MKNVNHNFKNIMTNFVKRQKTNDLNVVTTCYSHEIKFWHSYTYIVDFVQNVMQLKCKMNNVVEKKILQSMI